MIIVDTNVIAYLYLDGPHTTLAEAHLQRDADWNVPNLWRSEFRNVLVGHMRRGDIGVDEALAIQTDAERLLEGSEHGVDTGLVLELAHRSGCTAYDCEFVALAMQLETRVLTMDRKLMAAFRRYTLPLAAA